MRRDKRVGREGERISMRCSAPSMMSEDSMWYTVFACGTCWIEGSWDRTQQGSTLSF